MRWQSTLCDTEISGVAPALVAIFIGMMAALLGVGGGVFFIPLLVWLTGRSIKKIIPVNQITVFLTSLSVASGHVLYTGHVDASLALLLILAGAVGTAVGSRLKQRVSAAQVGRVFAFRPACGWSAHALAILPQRESQRAATPNPWARTRGTWLKTVGMALILGPLLAVIQHWLYERIPGSSAGERSSSDTK